MTRRSPRAVLAWVAAAAVALATAHLVATDLATLHNRARSLGRPRPVLVATRDLPLGSVIRAADLEVDELPSRLVPTGVVDRPARAVGRVVAVPLVKGAFVFARQLAAGDRTTYDTVIPDGTRAMRIVTEDGFRPPLGGVVDVLASLDPSVVVTEPAGSAVVVARAAQVIGVEYDGESGIGGAASVGVTLLVAEDEALRVAFAAANGVLTLALAPPEAACCPLPNSDDA